MLQDRGEAAGRSAFWHLVIEENQLMLHMVLEAVWKRVLAAGSSKVCGTGGQKSSPGHTKTVMTIPSCGTMGTYRIIFSKTEINYPFKE